MATNVYSIRQPNAPGNKFVWILYRSTILHTKNEV